MKHTRSILSQIHSTPSLEAVAWEEMPVGDAAEESFLALESAEIIATNDGQLEEACAIDDKADRLDTLVEYVESEVGGEDKVVTPNELALVEQAVDANLADTGEDTDEALPALESFEGTTSVSLEAIKDKINDFKQAAGALIKNSVSNLHHFWKVSTDRLFAIKDRIGKLETLLGNSEVKAEVEITPSVANAGANIAGSAIEGFPEIIRELDKLGTRAVDLGVAFPKELNAGFGKVSKSLIKVFSRFNQRGDEAAKDREEGEAIILAATKDTVHLVEKHFGVKGNLLGGLSIEVPDVQVPDAIAGIAPAFKRLKDVDFDRATIGSKVEVKGLSSATIRQALGSIKRTLAQVSKIKPTAEMKESNALADIFSGDIYHPLLLPQYLGTKAGALLVNGVDGQRFANAINATVSGVTYFYTHPTMKVIDHYITVANAVLTIAEKSLSAKSIGE